MAGLMPYADKTRRAEVTAAAYKRWRLRAKACIALARRLAAADPPLDAAAARDAARKALTQEQADG